MTGNRRERDSSGSHLSGDPAEYQKFMSHKACLRAEIQTKVCLSSRSVFFYLTHHRYLEKNLQLHKHKCELTKSIKIEYVYNLVIKIHRRGLEKVVVI